MPFLLSPVPVAARRGPVAGAILLALATLALSACNSTSLTDGLSPTASTAGVQRIGGAPQPAAGIGGAPAAAPQADSSAPQATALAPVQDPAQAALPQVPAVAFLPVTGAPQSAVTQLASAMRNAAQAYAVPVVISVDRGARYQVKGYFSALNDGSGTVLVYVWDILDANGVRVHRISGQERGSAAAGDPWAGIDDNVIARVADSTMNNLRSWATTRGAG